MDDLSPPKKPTILSLVCSWEQWRRHSMQFREERQPVTRQGKRRRERPPKCTWHNFIRDLSALDAAFDPMKDDYESPTFNSYDQTSEFEMSTDARCRNLIREIVSKAPIFFRNQRWFRSLQKSKSPTQKAVSRNEVYVGTMPVSFSEVHN